MQTAQIALSILMIVFGCIACVGAGFVIKDPDAPKGMTSLFFIIGLVLALGGAALWRGA